MRQSIFLCLIVLLKSGKIERKMLQKYVVEHDFYFFAGIGLKVKKKIAKTFGQLLEVSLYLQSKKRVNSLIVWRATFKKRAALFTNHLV